MDIRLGSIHVYPFKSMAGVELNSLELDDFGPKHDRRWMLVDGKNSFITQRQVDAEATRQLQVLDARPLVLRVQAEVGVREVRQRTVLESA